MSVVIKNSKGAVIDHLTQWDCNRTVHISGLTVTGTPTLRAHFFNVHSANALVVELTAESDGVYSAPVPNILLVQPEKIVCWIYEQTEISGSESYEGESIYKFELPVIPRSKPADFEYQENIDYLNWVELSQEAAAIIASWQNMSAVAHTLPSDSDATANYQDGLFTFGIPQGVKGDKGDKGDTGATGPQGPKGDDGAIVYLDSSVYPGYDLTERFSDEIAGFGGDPWAWIKGRVQAGDLSGINPKDYIPVTVNGKRNDACVLGVNTYKNAGPSSGVIGDHVDFMLRHLWLEKRGINKVNWNNGLIPKENGIAYDNELAIQLTKPMASVASVKIKPADSTDFRDAAGWTYDATSKVITLTNELAVSGIANVTGAGSEFPWLASDAYLWLNGLDGNVAANTTAPPSTAISYVDYGSGVNNPTILLPQALRNVITHKKLRLFKRYSDSGLLNVDGSALDFIDLGAFWLPTELEVFGTALGETNAAITNRTSVQYPFFANSMERIRYWYNAQGNLIRSHWWLLNQHQGSPTKWSMILDEGAGVVNNASLGFGLPVCFRVAKT